MKITKRLKLKNAARDNRRYLLIQEPDSEKIEKAILDYIGILGFAKSAYLKVLSENNQTIGSIKREELEKVKAALALAGINITKISGTLKGLSS
jgi:RNase P/RNase MRP subunit POP5